MRSAFALTEGKERGTPTAVPGERGQLTSAPSAVVEHAVGTWRAKQVGPLDPALADEHVRMVSPFLEEVPGAPGQFSFSLWIAGLLCERWHARRLAPARCQ